MTDHDRFRLSRGGVLNVWQYDEQVFDFAGGRLLLRGANGAGKSKTMEMLLPFVVDGDKARMTASGRHHTSLLWLMLDGYDGAGRTGYLWVEFTRRGDDGRPVTVTCGVGIKASQSARAATAWFFTSPRRVGDGLLLEDESGPLSQQRLKAEVEADGAYFDSAVRYREHVGGLLFGLPPDQYDELLRLLYWLRQPQVGEDIDPKRLAAQLVQALPQVDGSAVRTAGDTFDELEAFGEQIDRRARAAAAIGDFVETYAGYARAVLVHRGTAVLDADAEVRRRRAQVRRAERALGEASEALARTTTDRAAVDAELEAVGARIVALENGPEARTRQRLIEMGKRVADLDSAREQAGKLAEAAAARAVTSANRADEEGDSLASVMSRLHHDAGSTAAEISRAGAVPGLPAIGVLARPELDWRDAPDGAAALDGAVGVLGEWSRRIRGPVGERRAAVGVVDQARRDADAARDRATDLEVQLARAEARVEQARRRASDAAAESRSREVELADRLAGWLKDEDAVVFELPELSADGLGQVESMARSASSERHRRLRDRDALAWAELNAAQARRLELAEQRERIEAEVDPAPPSPAWHRDDRSERPGAPLWRLVDFQEQVAPDDRAGIEAALEGSGLLDAWVHPDGRVHRADAAELMLVVDGALDAARPGAVPGVGATAADGIAASLASVLRVDVSAPASVSPEVVSEILRRVGFGLGAAAEGGRRGIVDDSRDSVRVDAAGRWQAGPMLGRTRKDAAQYIGATARAAERRRRLDEVDAGLRDVESAIVVAQDAQHQAERLLARLDAWLAARPRHDQVLRAWAAEEERVSVAESAVRELTDVAAHASAARGEAAARHTELETLADQHGLPTSAEGLQMRLDLLASIAAQLELHERAVVDVHRRLASWVADATRARADLDDQASRMAEVEDARVAWVTVRDELDELTLAEGATLIELEERLAALRDHREVGRRRQQDLDGEHDRLLREVGSRSQGLENDREALVSAEPVLEETRRALAALAKVPGLLAGTGVAADPRDVVSDADPGSVRRLVERASESRTADANAVLQASSALQSGPAALNEPRVVEVQGVLAALGRDDSGELTMVDLARRLSASVAADRELLSDRERNLFENHVLGHLGDALRGVRLKADELVQAMNDQLHDITTSQGIRVRLRWRLRDDIPAEARRAVQLLGEPLGALLPDERAELRDSLHRLIDVSRAEAPEESYAEHLARALDYRQWYAFTVQYHRPETGEWRDLHRKTALSQGEQKVLCYLPLFAAAAAHFASVAGAAPYAPRFVLLDDAFPKIDVRTHPLLFGLLVDLDLDFIVTSERLWGTHSTVPELAIYEALRSPSERGIAQYEHRWDGQQLTAVGA